MVEFARFMLSSSLKSTHEQIRKMRGDPQWEDNL